MTIILVLLSGLASAIVTQILSNRFYSNQERRKQKLDILKQLLGNRIALTSSSDPITVDRFFEASNSSFAVFYDNKTVLQALDDFHLKSNQSSDNAYNLIVAICKDLKINTSELSKDFFLKPFRKNQNPT